MIRHNKTEQTKLNLWLVVYDNIGYAVDPLGNFNQLNRRRHLQWQLRLWNHQVRKMLRHSSVAGTTDAASC